MKVLKEEVVGKEVRLSNSRRIVRNKDSLGDKHIGPGWNTLQNLPHRSLINLPKPQQPQNLQIDLQKLPQQHPTLFIPK